MKFLKIALIPKGRSAMYGTPHFLATGLLLALFLSPGLSSGAAHPALQRAAMRPASFTPASAGPSGEPPQAGARAEKQWEAIGLSFTQSLTAVEKAYQSEHGKYESTMDLYRSGAMNGAMQGLARTLGIGTLRNWRWQFFVDASPDGKQYQASVHGTNTQSTMKCLPVFFTDQTGVVYEGKQVGCR